MTASERPDTWRTFALDISGLITGGMELVDLAPQISARRDALLAVEDEHPPTANRGRAELQKLLERIAQSAHAVGNEPIYDDALDALDILAGWVPSRLKLDEPTDQRTPGPDPNRTETARQVTLTPDTTPESEEQGA